MLSSDIFRDGLRMLVIEFEDKGFKMSQQRAEQWYGYLKTMSDSEFTAKVDYVIKNCSYVPSMADVFKANIDNGNAYKPFDFSNL